MEWSTYVLHFFVYASKTTFLAAGLGLEPRYFAPEANVLPLDDPAIDTICKIYHKNDVFQSVLLLMVQCVFSN